MGLKFLAVLTLIFVAAGSARAADRFFVLFDYTHPDDPSIYTARNCPLPPASQGVLPKDLFQGLLKEHFQRARGLNRFLTRPQTNAALEVYVVAGKDSGRISIPDMNESSRDAKSQVLVKALSNPPDKKERASSGELSFLHRIFPLQYNRGSAAVRAGVDGRESTALVVTGPQEDVYLSANLPIDYLTLKGERIPAMEQPREFYLSLDYIPFGDLYLQDLQPVVRFCAKISDSPFDTFGMGLGARLPNFWGVMDLSNVTLSVNLLRAQGDKPETWYWNCQVGYNLFSLLPGWFP